LVHDGIPNKLIADLDVDTYVPPTNGLLNQETLQEPSNAHLCCWIVFQKIVNYDMALHDETVQDISLPSFFVCLINHCVSIL
jgi:hypothetical protein